MSAHSVISHTKPYYTSLITINNDEDVIGFLLGDHVVLVNQSQRTLLQVEVYSDSKHIIWCHIIPKYKDLYCNYIKNINLTKNMCFKDIIYDLLELGALNDEFKEMSIDSILRKLFFTNMDLLSTIHHQALTGEVLLPYELYNALNIVLGARETDEKLLLNEEIDIIKSLKESGSGDIKAGVLTRRLYSLYSGTSTI